MDKNFTTLITCNFVFKYPNKLLYLKMVQPREIIKKYLDVWKKKIKS